MGTSPRWRHLFLVIFLTIRARPLFGLVIDEAIELMTACFAIEVTCIFLLILVVLFGVLLLLFIAPAATPSVHTLALSIDPAIVIAES